MTEQIPDTCTIDGRLWSIEEWDGSFDAIPDNKALGFETHFQSTANWAGRIDHYLVFKNQFYLFKVEVDLAEEDKNLIPFGARREVRQIYEPMEVHDSQGMRFEEMLHEHRYFIYDDLKIDFSGTLKLSFPVWDPWDVPWPVSEEDIEPTHEAELVFSEGIVVSFDSWSL